MEQTKPQYTYMIVNPNKPEAVSAALRQILIQKLLSFTIDSGMAVD